MNGGIVEYFGRARALSLVSRVPEARRAQLREALRVATQRFEAADVLWSNGHVVEGLRLDRDSLEASVAAATEIGDALGVSAPEEASTNELDPRAAAALRETGLSASRIDAVSKTLAASRAATLPRLDCEATAAHAQLHEQIHRATQELRSALAPAELAPGGVKRSRAVRIGAVATTGLLVLGGIVKVATTTTPPSANASATWQDQEQYRPAAAIDGNPETAWLLPDRQPGWVDLVLGSPRRVDRVRLVNAHNAPWNDRATNEYVLEIYAGGQKVREIPGSFEWSETPQPVVVDVGVDAVERVRFAVRSHHHLGAGLAELAVE